MWFLPIARHAYEAPEPSPIVLKFEVVQEATLVTPEPEPECRLSPRWPDKIYRWCELIDRYSALRDLDPNLVAAVMLQESGGNPDAYSRSGAVGLIQVMPRDGLAGRHRCRCFGNRPTMAELYDPAFNLEYGTGMLRNLIDKYGGVRGGLIYYHGQPGGTAYANKVMAHYERYR